MSEKVDFDFAISVKAPEELRQLPDYDQINIDRWQITIETSPGQSSAEYMV
ncbi:MULTISPECIES: hypothetical protein [Rahnella]|uniref:Uncharacterized protein n=1 Tax=Rahnella sp. (strain Y9602) TaxID=2703885 RepID=A0ABW6CAM5_RAHSY|nr:hypothetical protein [Rahnella sp. NRRL B-41462]MDP9707064.1 hypothetical protein [Rahnella aquatilis]